MWQLVSRSKLSFGKVNVRSESDRYKGLGCLPFTVTHTGNKGVFDLFYRRDGSIIYEYFKYKVLSRS